MKNAKKIILVLIVVLVVAVLYQNFRPVSIEDYFNYQIGDMSTIDSEEFDKAYAEFESGNYTVSDPYIAQNVNSKLNAYIMFNDDANGVYGYTVHGKEGTENTEFSYTQKANSKEGVVLLPVIGLYSDFENTVDILDSTGTVVNTVSIVTDAMEKELSIDVQSNEESVTDKYFKNGFIMTSEGAMFDQYGELRGTTPRTFNTEFDIFLSPGHGSAQGKDIMGRTIMKYDLPDYLETGYGSEFHHDFTYDTEGNAYLLTGAEDAGAFSGPPNETIKALISERHAKDPSYTIESSIYKYDPSGNLIWAKSYDEYFDENLVHSIASQAAYDVDPVHYNSIEYNKVDGQEFLLVSSRTQDGFLAIEPNTGEILWKFGSVNQVRENYDMYLDYDPETTPVPSGQHTARLLRGPAFEDYYRDGKYVVSVFNNNFCKGDQMTNFYTSNRSLAEAGNKYAEPFCVVKNSAQSIYIVDPKANTVEFYDEIPYLYDWSPYISSVFQIDDNMYYATSGLSLGVMITDDQGREYFYGKVDAYFTYRSFLVQEEELTEMLDLASVIE